MSEYEWRAVSDDEKAIRAVKEKLSVFMSTFYVAHARIEFVLPSGEMHIIDMQNMNFKRKPSDV